MERGFCPVVGPRQDQLIDEGLGDGAKDPDRVVSICESWILLTLL